jgi:hypothetical protein
VRRRLRSSAAVRSEGASGSDCSEDAASEESLVLLLLPLELRLEELELLLEPSELMLLLEVMVLSCDDEDDEEEELLLSEEVPLSLAEHSVEDVSEESAELELVLPPLLLVLLLLLLSEEEEEKEEEEELSKLLLLSEEGSSFWLLFPGAMVTRPPTVLFSVSRRRRVHRARASRDRARLFCRRL